MADDAPPQLIPRLYDQLQDRLRAHDKDGAIEAYCQLFLAGRPLDEIIAKGSFNHARGDSNQHNPVEGAPVEQVVPARVGAAVSEDAVSEDAVSEDAVSEDERAADPDSVESGSDMTSEAQAVGVTGLTFDEQSWFVRNWRWVVGVPIAIFVLVTPVMLVSRTNIEKVAVAIKTATDTARFAISPASTASVKAGPTAAGPTAQSNTTPPSPAADAPGQPLATAVEAGPRSPVAAAAAPKVAGPVAGQVQSGRTPATSPVDASSQSPATAVEVGSTQPVATATAPKVVGTNEEQDKPSTSLPSDASGQAPAASGEAAPTSPVAAAPVLKVVTAGDRRSLLNATKPTPPAELSGRVPSADETVAAAPNSPVSAAAAPKIVAAVQAVRGEPGRSELETKTLVARGDALLGTGDLTAARLFYRRGADLGDGTAALRLGETFDPAFLQQAGLGRIAGDVKSALYWYQWAHALGNADADLLTKGLIPLSGNKQ